MPPLPVGALTVVIRPGSSSSRPLFVPAVLHPQCPGRYECPLEPTNRIGEIDPLGTRRGTVELRVAPPDPAALRVEHSEPSVGRIVAGVHETQERLVDRCRP